MRTLLRGFNKAVIAQQKCLTSREDVDVRGLERGAIFRHSDWQRGRALDDLGEVAFLSLWEMLIHDIDRVVFIG